MVCAARRLEAGGGARAGRSEAGGERERAEDYVMCELKMGAKFRALLSYSYEPMPMPMAMM